MKKRTWGALLVSTKERGHRARLKRALGLQDSFCDVYERVVTGRAERDVHRGVGRCFLLFYTDIVNVTTSSTSLYLYTCDTIYEVRGGQDRERALEEILRRIQKKSRTEGTAE